MKPIILIFFLICSFSYGKEGVGVLVIDVSFDLENEELSRALDLEFMNNYITTHSGEELSLSRFNQRLFERNYFNVNKETFNEGMALLGDGQFNPPSKDTRTFQDRIKNSYHRAFSSSKKAEEKEKFSLFIHGTHVASVAVYNNPNSRLVTFPLISNRVTSNFVSMDRIRRRVEREYKEISKIIREADIKVVNMSNGFSYQQLVDFAVSKYPPFLKNRVRKIQEDLLEVYKEETLKLYNSHPGTVFVRAAGNLGMNLDESLFDSSHLSSPNLIVVGSHGQAEKLSDFTNYSKRYVHVTAEGENIYGALPGGSKYWFSGTSLSTPQVANIITDLYASDPNLLGKEAIKLFINKATRKVRENRDFVHGGRALTRKKFAELKCLEMMDLFT